MVECIRCKNQFDPEEDGSAEINGLDGDGNQTGPTMHMCLDCFFAERGEGVVNDSQA